MKAISFSTAPIGIFDSGLGGLTVLRQVRRLLPAESILYFADTANVPYGDKPLPVVRDLALTLTRHLIEAGAKLVIMASGTSTVAGLEAAQACYPQTPILGTIEAGARATVGQSSPVGIIATNATAQSQAFTRAIQSLSPEHTVIEVGCPRFVPLIESGRAESEEALDACLEYLTPLLEAKVRTIVLGCTHFPFLLPALKEAASLRGCSLCFIDPAEESVREAAALLAAAGQLASRDRFPTQSFAATSDPDSFAYYASRLLHEPLMHVAKLIL